PIGPDDRVVLLRSFDGSEEPGAVLQQGAPNRSAVLVTIERWLTRTTILWLREVIDGHDVLVSPVRSGRSMQHIRARLGGHQDRRCSLPIFSRCTGRDRLELLDAFQAVDDARSPAVILFVVDPVDEHVVVLATAAGKRDVRLSVAMG